MRNITILVNTCDSYSDVLEIFFAAFKEYWPDCPYKIVINSEKKDYSRFGVSTHYYKNKDGDCYWGDRLLRTLKDIDTDYVLVVYDDFILEERVNNLHIEEVLKYVVDEKAAVCYLTKILTSQKPYNSCLNLVVENANYKLNSAPAIWNRNKLIEYTGKYDNPWGWEVFGSYRTYRDKSLFFVSKKDIYKYDYSRGGAIYRGKWVRHVVEDKINKYDIDLDLSIRGFSSEISREKRSFRWRVNFLKIGYKMVGLKVFIFIFRYVMEKFNARKI